MERVICSQVRRVAEPAATSGDQGQEKHMNEDILKALHSANMLAKDLLVAHSNACVENRLLEIILFDLLDNAVEIEKHLKKIEAALNAESA